jgi:hypothetical protein
MPKPARANGNCSHAVKAYSGSSEPLTGDTSVKEAPIAFESLAQWDTGTAMQRHDKTLQLARFEHRMSSEDRRNGRGFVSRFLSATFRPPLSC